MVHDRPVAVDPFLAVLGVPTGERRRPSACRPGRRGIPGEQVEIRVVPGAVPNGAAAAVLRSQGSRQGEHADGGEGPGRGRTDR
jgi:hypothetical protein